jgi:hypothetical protein
MAIFYFGGPKIFNELKTLFRLAQDKNVNIIILTANPQASLKFPKGRQTYFALLKQVGLDLPDDKLISVHDFPQIKYFRKQRIIEEVLKLCI